MHIERKASCSIALSFLYINQSTILQRFYIHFKKRYHSKVSSYPTVSIPPYHHTILSSHHPVIIPSCHHSLLTSFPTDIITNCHHFIQQPFSHQAIVAYCHNATYMLVICSASVVLCWVSTMWLISEDSLPWARPWNPGSLPTKPWLGGGGARPWDHQGGDIGHKISIPRNISREIVKNRTCGNLSLSLVLIMPAPSLSILSGTGPRVGL